MAQRGPMAPGRRAATRAKTGNRPLSHFPEVRCRARRATRARTHCRNRAPPTNSTAHPLSHALDSARVLTSGTIRFRFTGVIGSSMYSDMAVDDVGLQFGPSPAPTISNEPTFQAVMPYECDFEVRARPPLLRALQRLLPRCHRHCRHHCITAAPHPLHPSHPNATSARRGTTLHGFGAAARPQPAAPVRTWTIR